jgi:hypothetical protein
MCVPPPPCGHVLYQSPHTTGISTPYVVCSFSTDVREARPINAPQTSRDSDVVCHTKAISCILADRGTTASYRTHARAMSVAVAVEAWSVAGNPAAGRAVPARPPMEWPLR